MKEPREAWNIRPLKKKIAVSSSIKSEVEAKAKELIENVLKPIHAKPTAADQTSNHIVDITGKWFRGDFIFSSTYACPSPNAIFPSFESKFARMEHLGDGKFALYFMRYTGKEWVGILDQLAVDEAMKAIADDTWFHP